MRSFLVGLLVAGALLAGCFSQDGTESTAPSPVGVPTPAPGAPDTPLGGAGTGCTGNHSVGAGNGDITSDHACPSTNTTNATI